METKKKYYDQTLTEYAETEFMPTDSEFLVALYRNGIRGAKLTKAMNRFRELDRSAVGRYIGRKSGLPMHESDEMLERSSSEWKKYQQLVKWAKSDNG